MTSPVYNSSLQQPQQLYVPTSWGGSFGSCSQLLQGFCIAAATSAVLPSYSITSPIWPSPEREVHLSHAHSRCQALPLQARGAPRARASSSASCAGCACLGLAHKQLLCQDALVHALQVLHWQDGFIRALLILQGERPAVSSLCLCRGSSSGAQHDQQLAEVGCADACASSIWHMEYTSTRTQSAQVQATHHTSSEQI